MCIRDRLGINDNDYILDMCAAPGGKSTSAAELAKNGKVVAWEMCIRDSYDSECCILIKTHKCKNTLKMF